MDKTIKIFESISYWRKEHNITFGVSDYFICYFAQDGTLTECTKIIGATNTNICLMFPDVEIIYIKTQFP
jgi:hypothetical protein